MTRRERVEARRRVRRSVVALSWVVLPVAALFSILASGAIGALTPLGALTPEASAQAQTPPPACTPNSRPTPSQTEGPFYKPNSPQRTSLVEPGMAGTKITVTGFLFSTDCRPVARARLDFWQADDRGAYDNTGYRLRGHTFADDAGRYSMETILPGSYTGRTRHIHVKVQAPNRPALTTQLYFPDEARNQNDGIFNQNLIVTMRDTPAGKVATFNFILDLR